MLRGALDVREGTEHPGLNSRSWVCAMDRPKQRVLVVLAFLLLTGGAALLLSTQQTSTPNPIPVSDTSSTRQLVEPQPHKVLSPATEAIAPKIAEPASIDSGFRGQVIDAVTRKPVKGFEVTLIRIHRDVLEPPIKRGFKSASGRFTWRDIAPGNWRVTVSAPGYQMFSAGELQLSEGKITSEIVMPLLRGFAIRGRVSELTTGRGLADATISFRKAGGTISLASRDEYAKSHTDGAFVLNGVPGGEIVISVGAANHAYREIIVFVDDKTPEQEIALSAGATIAGIVMTTSGGPAKGKIHLQGPGPGYLSETTDAGEFSFRHMPAGRYKLSADTSAGSTAQVFELQQDEIKEGVLLVVGAGRSIRGLITGLRPEQFQHVGLHLHSESNSAFSSAVPDERGAYSINGVLPGPATLTLIVGTGFELQKPVHMPADHDLTLDIAVPVGSQLSGRITEEGKRASDKGIWMRPVDDKMNILHHARTEEDGSYKFESVPAGDYFLRAEGDISRRITIAGDTTLNIDIPSVQLAARVVEDGGSVPIVGANVYLRGSAPETARVRGDKQTDDFGQFALTGIEPGEIALLVYKPGYEIFREMIAYSTPITNKTITLRKSAGVEVRIRPGSRRFPRGFTLTQRLPSSEYVVDLWMPVNREGICYIPIALAGTTFEIGRFSGEPIVINEWDGQPLDLP
jgi:hypothetical protein